MASNPDAAAFLAAYSEWVENNRKLRLQQEQTIQCTPVQQQSLIDSIKQIFDTERDAILKAVFKHIDQELDRREQQRVQKEDKRNQAIDAKLLVIENALKPTAPIQRSRGMIQDISSNSSSPSLSTPRNSSSPSVEIAPNQSREELDEDDDDSEEQPNNRPKRPINVNHYQDPLQPPRGRESSPPSSTPKRCRRNGTWQTFDIGYGGSGLAGKTTKRDAMDDIGLSENIIQLIIEKDRVELHHRKSNLAANKGGQKECWLAKNNPLLPRAGENVGDGDIVVVNPEARSEDAPCGMCRTRIEDGEEGIECFYFKTAKTICIFR
ncbi:uncharacterized protein PAC_09846 [Phialocephala subalpina]|uniref:Uncharacterized protein n=1 Tax=Phialocephala subalpina TaxID=576137 RepID=A0A1L7X4K0_9HELO|nr:uncharacterized protein PAC_09846 [Phialocephala subalpina]